MEGWEDTVSSKGVGWGKVTGGRRWDLWKYPDGVNLGLYISFINPLGSPFPREVKRRERTGVSWSHSNR